MLSYSNCAVPRLTSEAANQIFKKAKDRVYRVVSVPPAPATTTTGSGASVGGIAELRACMARAHGLNAMIQPSGGEQSALEPKCFRTDLFCDLDQ